MDLIRRMPFYGGHNKNIEEILHENAIKVNVISFLFSF